MENSGRWQHATKKRLRKTSVLLQGIASKFTKINLLTMSSSISTANLKISD